MDETTLERARNFHGHVCFGLLTGLRAAEIALRELGAVRAADEELVAIAETDGCGVDGLQVITGCTVGKGNLWLRDWGKHVYTVGSRRDGRAVRVALNYQPPEQLARLRNMTPPEYLAIPEGELFRVSQVNLELPPPARLFGSLRCARCGEGVMEARARVRDGQVVCIPCADQYPSRFS